MMRKKFATGVWGNELYNRQFFEVGDLPVIFLFSYKRIVIWCGNNN